MKIVRLAICIAATAGALAACHHPPPDSPPFHEAFELYNQLYTEKLDDAFGDPKMAEVQTLLTSVDPASAQAGEAHDLLVKVEQGLADYKKQQARVVADEKAAVAPAPWQGSPLGVESRLPPPPAPTTGPSLGMTRDDFLAKFSSCFDLKGLYQSAEGKRGEAYSLRTSCAGRYPALAGSMVILLEGRVSQLVADADIRTITADAGPPEEAVAAPPARKAPPPPPAPPPVRWLPGAPHP